MKNAVLLCILALAPTDAIFSNSLKKLKQKTKEAYKKKFGKDKTWHFLGFDLTEFPGTNEQFRQTNKEKWDDYYACLLAQNSSLGHDSSVTPRALQAIESGSVRLDCKLCSSPEETQAGSVEWFFAAPDDRTLKPVEYTENMLLAPSDQSLHIYNLNGERTGQYACRIGKSEAPPYFLTVFAGNDADLREVHINEAPHGPYPQPATPIPNYDLVVDTEWTSWSSCSKCDHIGRRHRLGYCIVKHQQHSTKLASNTTEEESVIIPRNHYELLRIFKLGIPCKSHILPRSLKKLHHVTSRKDEIMTGFCRVVCPEDTVFEVHDKDGNVIETANNSAGIYSLLQGIPSMQPSVERLLQFADKEDEVVLTCPGNLNSEVPVQWKLGAKNLVPELIVAESHGRIYISITDKIHIKNAKVSDSNIYSCWQHHDLAGTVRLVVEKRLRLDFNHHIMLLGSVLIFSVFLYVLVKAFFRRKHAEKAT